MKVVLDSNILLSALLSPTGCPNQVYSAWQDKRFELVTAQIQMDEIRRASRYPKFRGILQPHRVGRMVSNLQDTTIIDPLGVEHEAKDPNDAWLLTLAEKGWVDFLVTGDKRAGLLALGHIGGAQIVIAKTFCELLQR